ncbi:peptide-methionine (S)-S-oxide reductase [Oceanisphaera sp. IT1-181]|uniref:peptide-methionine (S)-S-oxide reductase n=1 Tax=Oceanisphaera sp. IT1-181 TaxID=3081199 RepID=UPI0029C9FF6B|nr:peptide-methionine (S)-S-oxide reductase [Oceanisphaera sp. IT1-181]
MLRNLLAAMMMCSISGPLLAAQAIFAGGSFWVMEALFAERVGIKQVDVGWIQSSHQHTRRQVVRVEYDAKLIGYGDLLTLYWAAVDAKDGQGQYCDRGAEFSPALYVQTPLQQRWAQQSRAQQALMLDGSKLEGSTLDTSKLDTSKLGSPKLDRKLAVRILPVGDFMPAEARHQHYYRQHPWLYANYRRRCGYPAGEKLTVPARASVPFATTALSAQQ